MESRPGFRAGRDPSSEAPNLERTRRSERPRRCPGPGSKGKKSGPKADFTKGRVKIVPVALRFVAAAND